MRNGGGLGEEGGGAVVVVVSDDGRWRWSCAKDRWFNTVNGLS